MDIADKTAIVTGGAGGIGAAVASELLDGSAQVLIVDLDQSRVDAKVAELGEAHADRVAGLAADLATAEGVTASIRECERVFGFPDIYFANAGIGGPQGLGDSDEDWQKTIDINVMAHVRAARELVPMWQERGSGYFISTASAAGLLTQIGAAAYSVTKHAAVAFAEWLAVTYGADGIGVSCLCPMGVNTDLLKSGLESDSQTESLGARVVQTAGEILEPKIVGEHVVTAIQNNDFLVLPHPEVMEFFGRKGSDYPRWIRGMQRLQSGVRG